MRVLYDGFCFSRQKVGGVSRYFRNIIGRLPEPWQPTLTLSGGQPMLLPRHRGLQTLRFRPFRPRRVSQVLERRCLDARVAQRSFDLCHPTYYTLLGGRSFVGIRAPVVITVWDMIHEIFRKEMDPTGQVASEKREAILAADALLCISRNTRDELVARYPQVSDRAVVTHLASDMNELDAAGGEPVPEPPYFLHVGARGFYKNFGALLDAFEQVASCRRELRLCVAGEPLDRQEEIAVASRGLSGRVLQYVNPCDKHLARLYRCSVALVYPSLHEGFGIPVLEAMACGTAVIAMASSSIPEVAGDAALLIDPDRKGDLVDALLLLADKSSAREALVTRGRERAATFRWERTVAATCAVYAAVAGGRVSTKIHRRRRSEETGTPRVSHT